MPATSLQSRPVTRRRAMEAMSRAAWETPLSPVKMTKVPKEMKIHCPRAVERGPLVRMLAAGVAMARRKLF